MPQPRLHAAPETADHCLAPTSICSAGLPEHGGLSLRVLLVDFFISTEDL